MTDVEKYLYSKRNAWSPVTIKNTKAVLECYGAFILKGNPENFYNTLVSKGISPYSRQTMFVIAGAYWQYFNKGLSNPFKEYRRENRNVFKNAYQNKKVNKSYEEVKSILESQEDSQEKTKALQLLSSAQRFSESFTSSGGYIVGKGGKVRPDYRSNHQCHATRGLEEVSYDRFYRWLKRTCSISPHDLRKLALTRAASKGATLADLCEIAGWNSISTAQKYLQPSETSRLKEFLK